MKNAFWTPSREWQYQDCFIIGGGPSLSGFDFGLLRGRNVIGTNDAFHLGGDIVTINAFADAGWWHRNKWVLEKFTGRLVTNAPSLVGFNTPKLLHMKRERDGIHTGDTLGWNYSTGAMAINLAVSLGAQRVFLLGYDLSNTQTGRSHWHEHNRKLVAAGAFERFQRGFRRIATDLRDGVDVVNVTDGTSKLTCFRTMSFGAFQQYLLPTKAAAA